MLLSSSAPPTPSTQPVAATTERRREDHERPGGDAVAAAAAGRRVRRSRIRSLTAAAAIVCPTVPPSWHHPRGAGGRRSARQRCSGSEHGNQPDLGRSSTESRATRIAQAKARVSRQLPWPVRLHRRRLRGRVHDAPQRRGLRGAAVWRPKQAIYHEQIDTATEVLGTRLAMPVMTALQAVRLVHPEGDIGLASRHRRTSASATSRARSPFPLE